jgi:hypothetical protein
MEHEEQTDLEDVLNDAPETTAVEEAKGEKPPEPPSEEPQETQQGDEGSSSGQTVPLKALESERQKRQDLEKRLADLEGRVPQNQQQQQHQQPVLPDPYEDPEGYFRAQQEYQQRNLFETKAVLSQDFMRSQYEDYDEVEAYFADAAEKDPRLAIGLLNSPNPARFAYEQGKRQRLLDEIGSDPEAYKAKIRESVLAEVGGTVEQPPQNTGAKAPTSLAAVPSAPSRRDDKGRFAPASLSEILDG